ncbi:MAG: DUF4124 domain-containing protein [Burkholderiaceae bacterium]
MNPLTRDIPVQRAFGARGLWRSAIAAASMITTFAFAEPALAQYHWTDASGRKVYSDVPPHPAAKVSNLVRRPDPAARPATGSDGARAQDVAANGAAANGAAANGAAANGTTANGPAGAGAQPAVPTSLADREMAFRKRQDERAEADKKAAEKAAADARNAQACEDSRAGLRTLESGMRVTRINAAGEHEVLSDGERQQRISAIRRDLGSRC